MAYKQVRRETTVAAAVGDAFSLFEELAGEMREWYDNLSEGLQQTDKANTISETADSLESLSEPDVPECVGETKIAYYESVNQDKRRGPSRSVRCGNAVSLLNAVIEEVDAWVESQERGDDVEAAEQLSADLNDAVGEADGLEFPSMYG